MWTECVRVMIVVIQHWNMQTGLELVMHTQFHLNIRLKLQVVQCKRKSISIRKGNICMIHVHVYHVHVRTVYIHNYMYMYMYTYMYNVYCLQPHTHIGALCLWMSKHLHMIDCQVLSKHTRLTFSGGFFTKALWEKKTHPLKYAYMYDKVQYMYMYNPYLIHIPR